MAKKKASPKKAKSSRSASVHKAKFKEYSPCGEPFFSTKGVLKAAWHWSKVTCKRCLAVHEQEIREEKKEKSKKRISG